MNPHHAKERDKQSASKPKKAPEGSPAEESSEPPAEASAEGDTAPPMGGGMGMDMGMGDQGGEVSCPACGAHFPLELGLGQPQHPAMAGHGAVPTHESQGAAMPVLGGY